ncbi:MAG: hypothetical protein ACREEB_18335 [Caulobacteraceae bacterium]
MKWVALVPLAGALLWGCSQPAPPPQTNSGAVEARLSADEARIAALEGRVNTLEAAKSTASTAPPTARTFTLVETSKESGEPATVTRTPFQTLGECQAARAKALADAATEAQGAGRPQVEQLPSGATHITPARTPPKVTAVCS